MRSFSVAVVVFSLAALNYLFDNIPMADKRWLKFEVLKKVGVFETKLLYR